MPSSVLQYCLPPFLCFCFFRASFFLFPSVHDGRQKGGGYTEGTLSFVIVVTGCGGGVFNMEATLRAGLFGHMLAGATYLFLISGLRRSVNEDCAAVTDVSEQPLGSSFKGQAVDCLTLEVETDGLSRNVGKSLPVNVA